MVHLRAIVLIFVLFVLLSAGVLSAVAQACSLPAAQALAQVGTACGGLGDNSACYGHNGVVASFAQPAAFAAPGDIAPLPPLQSLMTRPYNAATGEWGIAVLRLDANLPGLLPGQSATLLLIGDVQVNAGGGSGAPMQAFNVRVGIGQAQCQGVPPSSITINGPQRGNLELTVNGAAMRLGSNVTIRQSQTGRLRFMVTAGRLTINGGPVIPVGFAVEVELDEDGLIIEETWEELEPISDEDLEAFDGLTDLPDEVFGEEYPLPSEDEIDLLAALDFDLLLELDPYLAFSLAEDWAEAGLLPGDIEGATAEDLEAYLFEYIGDFDVDDDFLAAMGDSFDLSEEDLSGLADELGIEFDPDALADQEDPPIDEEPGAGEEPPAGESPSEDEPPGDEAPAEGELPVTDSGG